MLTQQTRPDTAASQATAPYVTSDRFDAVVGQAPGLSVVDFTASWCPPCRMIAPHVDALARDLAGQVMVVKVDVDDQPDLATRFGVMSMPTLLFLRDGQVVDRIVGALPPERLRAKVDELRRV
jgi:thioredoxin 1